MKMQTETSHAPTARFVIEVNRLASCQDCREELNLYQAAKDISKTMSTSRFTRNHIRPFLCSALHSQHSFSRHDGQIFFLALPGVMECNALLQRWTTCATADLRDGDGREIR